MRVPDFAMLQTQTGRCGHHQLRIDREGAVLHPNIQLLTRYAWQIGIHNDPLLVLEDVDGWR